MDEKIELRMASAEDAEAIAAIYAPYVTETAITFEYEIPSVQEFRERISQTLERYPYLVAVRKGEILGYAYASAFKERAAYDWAVETSIYVKQGIHGKGVGSRLYEGLENLLRQQKIINVNACIAYPHPESEQFHQKCGYKKVAHFTKCGYKLGKWHDMIWMEKLLTTHPQIPEAVLPISRLSEECIRECIQ